MQRERTERGITLREISDATRVRTFYLEHIEAGEFRRLPSVPIGRGFVRAFANFISVDADAAAAKFDREIGRQAEKKLEALAYGDPIVSNARPRRGSRRLLVPVAAVVFFIIVSGALLWLLRGRADRILGFSAIIERVRSATSPTLKKFPPWKGSQLNAPAPDGVSTEKKARARANEAGSPSEVSPPAANGGAPNGAGTVPGAGGDSSGFLPAAGLARLRSVSVGGDMAVKNNGLEGLSFYGSTAAEGLATESPAPAEGPAASEGPALLQGPLNLQVLAIEDTWLRVVVDGKQKYEMLLAAGNTVNWRGSDKFVVTVGNVEGTKVLLNGTDVPLPKTSTNVLRDFVVTDKSLN
ncbi:MAG: RodZ domain-containing protein [bacterium]